MGYTRADIARMESELRGLHAELEETPERKDRIQKEIDNLKYHIEYAKKHMD